MNSFLATAIACVVAFFAVGIPHWQLAYAKVALPNSLSSAGLAVLFVVAAVIRFGFKASFVQACVAVGLAVPAAIMARVVVEVAQDPTSHNLWPVEIVIGSGVGLAVACAGAVAGGILAAMFQRFR